MSDATKKLAAVAASSNADTFDIATVESPGSRPRLRIDLMRGPRIVETFGGHMRSRAEADTHGRAAARALRAVGLRKARGPPDAPASTSASRSTPAATCSPTRRSTTWRST